ncbi:juvenile hormone esterase-like isoform X2 [Plodia interpunctella]|uniref:juvenile hormone esterase-like isoform X2 n=1 Tax=Plodia interpunctella TaxID=58824 RepID=UPI002367BAF6|nr:juvenile hormone esterase-like isoform X2 [Plodia interpunctella]
MNTDPLYRHTATSSQSLHSDKIHTSMAYKWLILWSLWATGLVRQPTAPLRVSSGWLRGSVASDGGYEEYLGIPYATVRERFQAPGPEPIWDKVFEAVEENMICRQKVSETTIGTDDCLFLNVYRPLNVHHSAPLPVMVFIHGGGYFEGTPSPIIYGPRYFMKKGVILVTISYRLNIQGFICLRIKEAPGNAAMKDTVAALRWVQRNIKNFGGDTDNVTIFGESAGAASVSYLVLSPMAKGLFHKAIQQSGSALCPWAYQFKPVYMASLLARTMGYHTQDPHKLYDYFMNKSNSELIVTRVPRKKGNLIISEILYTPCVEDVIEGEEPFLTEIPYNILSQGKFNKVPMMIGVNDAEGITFADLENDTTIPEINFAKSIPKDVLFPTDEERERFGEIARRLYLGDSELTESNLTAIVKFSGDAYFYNPILTETALKAKTSELPIYSFVFAYDGWRNFLKMFLTRKEFPDVQGAAHADDLFYLFSNPWLGSLGEDEMIDKMTTLWTNFAKYGDPTPAHLDSAVRWPRVDPEDPKSLVLNSTLYTRPLWASDTIQFWLDLYSKYRRTER